MTDDPHERHATAPEHSDAQHARALRQIMVGYRVTQALYVAAKLGVADLLAEGAQTVTELAAATGVNADALFRVLRALASVGVFAETSPQTFALTPLAAALRADDPHSVRDLVIYNGEDSYRTWADLLYSVQAGAPAFDHLFGAPHFTYLAQHPAAGATFDRAMTSGSRMAAAGTVGAYDFAAARTVVDVGGGHGRLLAAILSAYPTLRGILFDRADVVDGATSFLAQAGVADRCALVGGDFLSTVPEGGDIYTLRKIIHDWDDDHAITILRNCVRAMAPGAKVLVVESVVEPGHSAVWTTFLDLQMLVMNGGRERTAAEYARLFAAAGLTLTRIVPTGSDDSLIEGVRATGEPVG